MNCLFCSSEALPFEISGGLGEVSYALPNALRKKLFGCRIVLPLYKNIPEKIRSSMRFIMHFDVPVGWRYKYCGVFEAKINGIIYYLIDNEAYFHREKLYGFYDDAERFSFFSRAILEMIKRIDFKPDIIHCNDWQTALTPVFYKLMYSKDPWYYGIKTIFTIHNIQYQGKYGMEIIEDLIGIPKENYSVLEFDKCANFIKGAIETADRVTTVSPTYAQEIMYPYFSHGLDPMLREKAWKISGIINGIDYQDYNPKTDKHIYKNYSFENLGDKLENKVELQKRLCLEANLEIPIISMVTRFVKHKGLDLVRDALEQIMQEENIQFVVLGSGDYEYEEFFNYMQYKYPGKVCACHSFDLDLAHKIYAASDIFLMPSKSEPCGLAQMIALRYGTIPVVRQTGGLNDSVVDSNSGIGNGFLFARYDRDDMIMAIKRAIWGYWNREGWKVLIKRAMQYDFSWNNPADEYIKLYKSLM